MKTIRPALLTKYFLLWLLTFSAASSADDSEIFTAGNSTSSIRPQVLVILDSSGSMSYRIPGNNQDVIPPYPYAPFDPNTPNDFYVGEKSSTTSLTYPANDSFDYPPAYYYQNWYSTVDHKGDCWTDSDNKVKCKGNFINYQKFARIEMAKHTINKIIAENPQIDFGIAEFSTSGKVIHQHVKERDSTAIPELINTVKGVWPKYGTPLCDTLYEVYRYYAGKSRTYGAAADAGGNNTNYTTPLRTCQNAYVIYMTDGEPSGEDKSANDKIKALTKDSSHCGNYKTGSQNKEHCMPRLAAYMANPGANGLDGQAATGPQKVYTYTIGFATDQDLLFDTANSGKGQCYTTVGNNTDPAAGCIAVDDVTQAFEGALQQILKGSSSFVSPAVAVNSFTRTETLDHAYFAMFEPDTNPEWRGNLKKLKIYTGKEVSPHNCATKTNLTPGTVVDRSCNPAIASGSLQLDEGISTFWGTTNDGKQVSEGGFGQILKNNNSSRTFYTNKAVSGAAESMRNLTDLSNNDLHISGNIIQHIILRIRYLRWIQGKNSNGNTRDWVLGDIQHSKPLTLNYGARTSSYSKSNPDLRLVFGTNHGLLHFVEDSGNTVTENWSFFAKETAKNLPILFNNQEDTAHPYGIDGEISHIRLDANGDGNIVANDGDRMVIFFGLRRGGDSYYAIDVTNPDAPPKLLWRIDSNTPGFSELGQSWAVPVPMIIPGHRNPITQDNQVTGHNYKFALAISAGYDGQDDAGSGQGMDDRRAGDAGNPTDSNNNELRPYSSRGRGLFIVDAGTGSLIKSFVAPDSITSNNNLDNRVEDSRFKWSVAAPPTVIDSNGNGFHDRIYAVDTGGNVFRFDIGLGKDSNDNEIAIWSAITLASLGIDENSTRVAPDSSNDRRFFYQPEAAKTRHAGKAFDAIMIGSGNRAHPTATTATERYYMIRDYATTYRRYGSCSNDCVAAPAVIKNNNLFDTTNNLIQEGDAAQKTTASNSLYAAKGWYINLGLATGSINTNEQAMTKARLLSGVLSFTTFSPSGAINSQSCAPGRGSSRVYSIDVHTAKARFDNNGDDSVSAADRALGVYSGVSGGGTTAAIGNKYIDILTGDEVNSKLGMNAYGWFQEK
ncbi:hypothetical protein EOPP23_04745 [Endozoicomonas sp. OPT23]|uniref:pilus assembly protein n=1 Tax=Endozoicomonas sp. OPT23 TaxID=2072845 RepID=UPI00129A40C3|nr:PilC/PilY family type IV pilus protein [Endozoicomonas sp. OPT23]MRI32302.1 hypothetical protein [Endozoicomonas sp. OPT23]